MLGSRALAALPDRRRVLLEGDGVAALVVLLVERKSRGSVGLRLQVHLRVGGRRKVQGSLRLLLQSSLQLCIAHYTVNEGLESVVLQGFAFYVEGG